MIDMIRMHRHSTTPISASSTCSRRDASLTNQDLAARGARFAGHLPAAVRRLVDGGVIERRVALLSPDGSAPGLTAIVEVTLDRQTARDLDAFEARAVADEAVQQCYRVSPRPGLRAVLQVADMPAYHAFVQRLMTQDANVRNVKTSSPCSAPSSRPASPCRPRPRQDGLT